MAFRVSPYFITKVQKWVTPYLPQVDSSSTVYRITRPAFSGKLLAKVGPWQAL